MTALVDHDFGPRGSGSSGRRSTRDGESGFTMIELAVALTLTLILLSAVPVIITALSDASRYSQGISSGGTQARTAIQQLESRVQSASQVCLPTQMTTAGPTVGSGFGLRVLTLAFGESFWDQWMVNTTTDQLLEQNWPATWTAGNAVPAWTAVATNVVNSTTAPFSLPTVTTGSPQTASVDLQVDQFAGNHSQPVEVQASIAALNTPYSSSPSVTCATAASQEGWT
jgi:prepilin-type N-terminal cleavage/methylation domain-containing protein